MLLVVPCVLISLLWWMFDDLPGDRVRPLRPGAAGDVPVHRDVPRHQRDDAARAPSGTLERLLTMPMGKLDFLARLRPRLRPARRRPGGARRRRQRRAARPRRRRTGLAARRRRGRRRRARHGPRACSSAPSRTTEFQAVQFMPAFVLPQILLCGLFVPRERLPRRARGDQQRAAAVVRRRRDAGARRGRRPGRGLALGPGRGGLRAGRRWPSAPPRCGGGLPSAGGALEQPRREREEGGVHPGEHDDVDQRRARRDRSRPGRRRPPPRPRVVTAAASEGERHPARAEARHDRPRAGPPQGRRGRSRRGRRRRRSPALRSRAAGRATVPSETPRARR